MQRIKVNFIPESAAMLMLPTLAFTCACGSLPLINCSLHWSEQNEGHSLVWKKFYDFFFHLWCRKYRRICNNECIFLFTLIIISRRVLEGTLENPCGTYDKERKGKVQRLVTASGTENTSFFIWRFTIDMVFHTWLALFKRVPVVHTLQCLCGK